MSDPHSSHERFHQDDLPRRYGRLLRLRGRAVRSRTERQGSGRGRTARRARRGLRRFVRSPQVRRALGHAAAHRAQALSPGDLRRTAIPTAIANVPKKCTSADLVLAAGRNGLDRRSLSRHDRHRAAARPAAARRAPAPSEDESRDAAQLLDRDRHLAPDRESFFGPGQAQRRLVDCARAGGERSWRRWTCAKIPGVGKVTEQNLHALGIRKVGDLARFDEAFLEERFGKWGLALAGKVARPGRRRLVRHRSRRRY